MPGKAVLELIPKICENGKVFYVTTAFPPVPAGSSVINRNLLSRFDPMSFKVFSTKANISAKVETFGNMEVERIFRSFYFSSRVNRVLSQYQISSATKKLIKFAERENPSVIVGVFPDYYFLRIARDTAKELKIPLVAYLHDTIAESSFGTRLEKDALLLQEQVFNEASALLVMSDGMKDLYKEKYNVDSTPLQHTYLERVDPTVPRKSQKRQAFWGGDVYAINLNSVNRVATSLKNLKYNFFLATGHDKSHFEKTGLDTSNIEIGFFSERSSYLENLKTNSILILALDWPDESKIHRDELATIFPTKTPEYLASGVPIIVHCPEDYFLARFFRENNCGVVISERSVANLQIMISDVLENPANYVDKIENAFNTTSLFEAGKLSMKFKKIIDNVSGLNWGKKIDYGDFN